MSPRSILAAGLVAGAIGLSASAAPLTLSIDVPQSNFIGLQFGGSYPLTGGLGYDFAGQQFNLLTTIDSITVTLTANDGDTGGGDFDRNDLTLGLDGINTGIKLNDLFNNQIVTITTGGGGVLNAAAILAALQADGRLVGTVIDADSDGQGPSTAPIPDFIGFPGAVTTSLDITGQVGRGGGTNNVPLPAAVLLAPLGAGLAGVYSRRFRRAN